MGPNKVTIVGAAQPLIDGVKLLKKEQVYLYGVRFTLYFISPVMAFILLGIE
jgi:NADH:ubiquinone oxidoreductase subunit H